MIGNVTMKYVVGALCVCASVMAIIANGSAGAYEYKVGPGSKCSGHRMQAVVQSYTFGDSSLYSSWGRVDYKYNVPYDDLVYLWNFTGRTSTKRSGADAENAVESTNAACERY
jgi:hypothetical protein